MGRNLKHNYKDPYFLLEIEGVARDGASDKDIAKYLQISATYLCEIKVKYPELVDAIARARRPLNVIVENAAYNRAIGMKVKTITRRYLDKKCDCGKNPECPECKGTGRAKVPGTEVVQETETQLPPDPFSFNNWLKAKKPEIWNKEPIKVDITTDGNPFMTLIQKATESNGNSGENKEG